MSEDNVGEGSDSDVGRLEQRARLLLRAYPPGYRADRGEEILGTLLEATPPGRDWPPARDLASVLGGGLRARRDANRRQGAAASLRQAAVLGIALYISAMLSQELSNLRFPGWSSGPLGWKVLLPFVPLAATLAAAWSGRRWLATVTAVAAGAAIAYRSFSVLGPYRPTAVEVMAPLTVPLLLLAALVLLTRSAERPPRSWLWLPCLPVGVALLFVIADRLPLGPAEHALALLGSWEAPFASPYTRLSAIMVVMSVCWLATDFRPLTGLALGFAMMQSDTGLTSTLQLIQIVVPLAVASALVWLLRRRARMSPPAAS